MAISTSTFSGTDLNQAFSARFASVLERAPSIAQLLNRNWEAEARVAEHVVIDNLSLGTDGTAASTVPVAARNADKFKDDYQTPKEFNVNQQTFSIDQGGENSFKMYDRDIRRSGARGRGRVTAGVADLQARAVTAREDNIVTYMAALTTYTTAAPVAADLPKDDNTGPNGNAGDIRQLTYGTTTNYFINSTGLPKNNAARDALLESFDDLRLKLTRANLLDGTAVAGDLSAPVMLVSPELYRGIIHSLKDIKVSADAMNIALFRDVSAFNTALREDRVLGMNIVTSNALPTTSGASNLVAYVMTRDAITYAEDVPEFWSDSPRSMGGTNGGPFFSYHQVFAYGRKLVNANQMIKVLYPTKDS